MTAIYENFDRSFTPRDGTNFVDYGPLTLDMRSLGTRRSKSASKASRLIEWVVVCSPVRSLIRSAALESRPALGRRSFGHTEPHCHDSTAAHPSKVSPSIHGHHGSVGRALL